MNSEKLFLLTGFAGSGKTTVLSAVMKAYILSLRYGKVALTAVSNKAVKVMRKMARQMGFEDSVECLTCTKILGLKPQIDKDGKQEFVSDRDKEPTVTDYKVVVVDECSMLGADLFNRLLREVDGFLSETKIIFCGDSAQLRPVKEEMSPVFSAVPEGNRADLTEVVRYDGAVGITAEAIRSTPDWGRAPIIHTGTNEDKSKGVIQIKDSQHLEKLIIRAFGSRRYQEDPDSAKIICYTNAEVDRYNALVHRSIYGQGAPRFAEGLRLIAQSPIMIGNTVVMSTSEECEVRSVREGEVEGWRVWRLDVKIDEVAKERSVSVLHEDEESRFASKLDELRAMKDWRTFWDLKQMFAHLKPCYAITAHKSQGSTYSDAFILLQGILRCRNIAERQELAYVAFSRPKNRAFYL